MTWNDNLVCCLTDKLERGWQNQQHQLVLQHQIARLSLHVIDKICFCEQIFKAKHIVLGAPCTGKSAAILA